MRTDLSEPDSAFEFWLARVDTAVRVECYRKSVVIRTSRDGLSPERKRYFLHELVAEGFVPEAAEWGAGVDVKWVEDDSWLMPSPAVLERTLRQLPRVLAGAGLLWVALMVGAFVHSAGRPAGNFGPQGREPHRLTTQR